MRHFVHAFLNLLRCSALIGKLFVFSINLLDGFIVQLEIDNSGFIEDRTSCAIFDGLRHVIDIYVVSKDFLSIAIFL